MKIGIDARKISDYGIGTHIRNVVLPAALMTDDAEFVFYYDPASSRPQTDGRFRWVEEKASKYSVREHFSLAKKAKKDGIQLFHSPHYTLPLALSVPAIVTIHDLIHLKFPHFYARWKVKAAEVIIRQAIKKSRVVITVSQNSKKDILELFPEAETRIEVVYNRLSPEWVEPEKPLDLSRMGIEREFVLYVGNFKKHKGIDTLLKAHQSMERRPMLVLVGKSSTMDEDLTEELFSAKDVRILGMADQELLKQLYFQARVFIFPSLYEGFGYPPLEAMSCGAPVLSSDTPALKEVLGESCLFFKAGDAEDLREKLRLLLMDSNLRMELQRAGKVQAQKYKSDASPQLLSAVYKRFLS